MATVSLGARKGARSYGGRRKGFKHSAATRAKIRKSVLKYYKTGIRTTERKQLAQHLIRLRKSGRGSAANRQHLDTIGHEKLSGHIRSVMSRIRQRNAEAAFSSLPAA